jgi:hypothetical protein
MAPIGQICLEVIYAERIYMRSLTQIHNYLDCIFLFLDKRNITFFHFFIVLELSALILGKIHFKIILCISE